MRSNWRCAPAGWTSGRVLAVAAECVAAALTAGSTPEAEIGKRVTDSLLLSVIALSVLAGWAAKPTAVDP